MVIVSWAATTAVTLHSSKAIQNFIEKKLSNELLLQMYGEENHAGTQLIKHAGIFQRSISCMNIAEAVAEFYFRRNRYKGQVKIEADTYFSTKIILFQF